MTLNKCKQFLLMCITMAACCLFCAQEVYAQTSNLLPVSRMSDIEVEMQQLAIERERNRVAEDRLNDLRNNQEIKLRKIEEQPFKPALLSQADLEVEMARIDLASINLALAEVQQTSEATENTIRDLQEKIQEITLSSGSADSTVNKQLSEMQANLAYQRDFLKLSDARIKELLKAEKMAKERMQLQFAFRESLKALHESYEQQQRQADLNMQAANWQRQQQVWAERLTTLNKESQVLIKQGKTDTPEYQKLSLLIFEAEEQSNISHIQLSIIRLQNLVDDLISKEKGDRSVTYLRKISQQVDSLLIEIQQIKELLSGKINLLKQRIVVEVNGKVGSSGESVYLAAKRNLLNELINEYGKQLLAVDSIEIKLYEVQAAVGKNLRGALARRQGLPGFNLQEWVSLGKDLAYMSNIVLHAARSLAGELVTALQYLNLKECVVLSLLEGLWIAGWVMARHHLNRIAPGANLYLKRLSTSALWVFLELVRQNLLGLLVFAVLLTLFGFVGLFDKLFDWVLPLGVVWFCFKFATGLARLTLFETTTDHGGHDVKLYLNLRWTFVVGGILTALTVLAHGLPVSYEVLDFFNRLVMIFILAVALLLLKGWHVVPALIAPYIHVKRPYLRKIIRLLGILIPLTILSNAFLGLIGYVALAWTISKYEGWFLLTLTVFLFAKGLLKDLMELISSQFIRRLRNGWLWSEALLKPLDKVLQLVTFLLAGKFLFMLYGWDERSYIYSSLVQLMNLQLFALAGGAFTLYRLIELIIILFVLYWATKWAREFAYRWLFANIKDMGLRNSLSIFMQYAVVTVGAFIVLKVLGIESNSLMFIATGLAIGLGFGLRDLANNFVSGLLLLIERPVRKGDIVTIGEDEGVVVNIGMRAITVFTSDNSEVMVPNSEVFSKSFTNWTHKDSIVRSVVNIRLARNVDPHVIQTTILEVLKQVGGIVIDPPPEVHLKTMDDGMLDFQVRYYLNLYVTASRSQLRSTVLFAIWERFKELKIEAPSYPQQDIHIKSVPTKET